MKKIIALIFFLILISIVGFVFVLRVVFKAGKSIISTDIHKREAVLEDKEYTASAKITELEIALAHEDCEIIPYDGDKIFIQYNDDKNTPFITVSESGNTIKIKHNNSIFSNINLKFDERCFVKVFVPEGKLEDISLAAASGDVLLKDLIINNSFEVATASGSIEILSTKIDGNLDLAVASGDVKFTGSSVKKLSVASSSGDVFIKDSVIHGTLSVNTASGSINAENSTVEGKCEITSASGDMTYDTLTVSEEFNRHSSSGSTSGTALTAKSINAESASGDYNLKSTTIEAEAEISTTSGEVSLYLTEAEANYKISAHTTSGNTRIGNTNNSDSLKKINIITTSGDILVKFAD